MSWLQSDVDEALVRSAAKGERMVTPENTMSLAGQHALQDMVELQMYLEVQPQNKPWPLVFRRTNKRHEHRKPYDNPVESSTVMELLYQGFIEATSNRTFVVSKSGYQFHERENKRSSA